MKERNKFLENSACRQGSLPELSGLPTQLVVPGREPGMTTGWSAKIYDNSGDQAGSEA
jgi:hypothetical protein